MSDDPAADYPVTDYLRGRLAELGVHCSSLDPPGRLRRRRREPDDCSRATVV